MPNYVEYELENQTTILVQLPEDNSGNIRKAGKGQETIQKAKKILHKL